jgi:hypothetical protein
MRNVGGTSLLRSAKFLPGARGHKHLAPSGRRQTPIFTVAGKLAHAAPHASQIVLTTHSVFGIMTAPEKLNECLWVA